MKKKIAYFLIIFTIFYACEDGTTLYNADADIHTFVKIDTNVVKINNKLTITNLFQNIDSVAHNIITVNTIPCHARIEFFKHDTLDRWIDLEQEIDCLSIPIIEASKYYELKIDTSFSEVGIYKIKTIVDCFNIIKERNESNNADSVEVTIDSIVNTNERILKVIP